MKSTDYKAPHCAVFSTPVVTFSLLWPNIFLSTYCRAPSAYDPPCLWETNPHTHIKQPTKL